LRVRIRGEELREVEGLGDQCVDQTSEVEWSTPRSERSLSEAFPLLDGGCGLGAFAFSLNPDDHVEEVKRTKRDRNAGGIQRRSVAGHCGEELRIEPSLVVRNRKPWYLARWAVQDSVLELLYLIIGVLTGCNVQDRCSARAADISLLHDAGVGVVADS